MSSADTGTETETTETDTATPPTDDLRAGILPAFETELGDALVESHLKPGDDLWLRVFPSAWENAQTVVPSATEPRRLIAPA